MKGLISFFIILSFLITSVSCTTSTEEGEEEYSEDASVEESSSDESSEFDEDTASEESVESSDDQSSQDTAQSADESVAEEESLDENFEELTQEEVSNQNQSQQANNDVAEEDPFENELQESNTAVPPPQIEQPITEMVPPTQLEEPASTNAMGGSLSSGPNKVTNIQFKANENGGTVVIDTASTPYYSTRVNASTNQFIVEIDNAEVPKSLRRPFNTKDFQSTFASIDAVQKTGKAVIVVQLRNGSKPSVITEGNTLLIVADGSTSASTSAGSDGAKVDETQVLTSATVQEFLATNDKFYGKKITLETNDMDVRDAIKFITEDSGINLVISDEVKGKVNIKLRQVPWDQALIVIMKSQKLGYLRQGSVLQIAPLSDLRKEEEEASRLVLAKKALEPLKVRMVPISFAKVEDISKQIEQFKGERGRVVADTRTSSLVITDIEENINKMLKVIASLDIAPPQVLIEGKIVEASETFQHAIGVNWGLSGQQISLGGTPPVNLTQTLGISGNGSGANSLSLNLNVGTIKFLGDLTAFFRLFESKNTVNVLSSPRVVALHNEKANISQTTQIPLFQQGTSGTSNIVLTNVSFKDVSLNLDVTPQITNEGSVVMAVNVKREFAGSVVNESTGARPTFSRSASTKVLVKNGETAVIGGIYQNDTSDQETGVPGLKDLPLIGGLFRGKTKTNEKSELLIFLTPRILSSHNDNSSSNSNEEL